MFDKNPSQMPTSKFDFYKSRYLKTVNDSNSAYSKTKDDKKGVNELIKIYESKKILPNKNKVNVCNN